VQWLFFVRLFADLTGRLLPRVKRLALGSQGAVLALGLLMLALTPLFYLYIALAPPWLISDTLACGRARLPGWLLAKENVTFYMLTSCHAS
jgi:hypothetical protein